MAFLFLLVYLVVVYLRPAEWIPFFHGWQLGDVTLIGGTVLALFHAGLTRKGLVNVPHTGMLMALVAAVALSHLVHTYVGGMIGALTAFATIAVTYFLMINTVTSETRFRIVLWTVLALTALLAWQGVYQFQHLHGWAGQGMASNRRIRWISIFNDPNDLALAFVIMVPVLVAILLKRGFIGLKIVPLGLLGLVLYAIFLTNSRGGMLGLMAAITFFFVKRSRWVVPGMTVGGCLAALVFTFGPSRLGLLSATDESAYGRLDAWYYGFQLLKSSPLFGAGFNMFTEDYPITAHNSFMLAASELGLVGLVAWVGLLYTAFKGLSLVQRHVARLAPYAYGLQAGLVGFGATAFFLSRTYNDLVYLLCGLSASLYHVAAQQTDLVVFRLTRRDLRNILLWALGSLLLIQFAMKAWL